MKITQEPDGGSNFEIDRKLESVALELRDNTYTVDHLLRLNGMCLSKCTSLGGILTVVENSFQSLIPVTSSWVKLESQITEPCVSC